MHLFLAASSLARPQVVMDTHCIEEVVEATAAHSCRCSHDVHMRTQRVLRASQLVMWSHLRASHQIWRCLLEGSNDLWTNIFALSTQRKQRQKNSEKNEPLVIVWISRTAWHSFIGHCCLFIWVLLPKLTVKLPAKIKGRWEAHPVASVGNRNKQVASLLLVAMPFAPSSFFAPSSTARSP